MDVRRPPASSEEFDEFQAASLFCGRCRMARPVRERLLLVLPDGELSEYVCAVCGTSVGTRRVAAPPTSLILPR